jgi:hypothetical protein
MSWLHNTTIFAGQATAPCLDETLFAMERFLVELQVHDNEDDSDS